MMDKDYSVDPTEHHRIRTICRELKKENDSLKESLLREQAINVELVRRFESDLSAASQLQKKDKNYIEELERELRNCTQEIGFLQDQLNINIETNCTIAHSDDFEQDSFEVNKICKDLKILKEKSIQSDSSGSSLMRELDEKETELESSILQLEKVQSSFSSMQLEYQLEIESMKLDMAALEQKCFEAERLLEQATQEKDLIDTLFHIHDQEKKQMISSLEKENKELKQNLTIFEGSIRILFNKMEEHLYENLKTTTGFEIHSSDSYADLPYNLKEEVALLNGLLKCDDVVHSYLSKLQIITSCYENVKNEMQKYLNQNRETENLVSQLKEDLRQEKLKAKEEAEDLIQEMAELRYQISEMLEEERNHRVMIERFSLRRIQELEREVRKENLKSYVIIKHFHEANKHGREKVVENKHITDASEGSSMSAKTSQEQSMYVKPCCEDCLNIAGSHDYNDVFENEASTIPCNSLQQKALVQ